MVIDGPVSTLHQQFTVSLAVSPRPAVNHSASAVEEIGRQLTDKETAETGGWPFYANDGEIRALKRHGNADGITHAQMRHDGISQFWR